MRGYNGSKKQLHHRPKQGRSVIPERVKFITGLCSKYYFVSKHGKQGRRIGNSVVGNSFRLSIDHEPGITNGERDKKHRLLMAQFSYR